MEQNVKRDVAAVQDISSIASMLKVVLQTTGMGFACVARVTEEQWIACQVLDEVSFGLPAGGELPIRTTLCNEVRASEQEIVIDHVSDDPVYATHHTPELYGLQSYLAVPIFLADGSFFGTLCAIDPKPAPLRDSAALEMCRQFATLIGRYIDDQLHLQDSEAKLAESLETAELREQFIAVLGHDLRNPISALQAGTHLLGRQPQSPAATSILSHMNDATERMTALVEDLLDFAQGRLGGGIHINIEGERLLGPALDEVISEIREANADQRIDVRHDLERPIAADTARISQLLANLLRNAIRHGSPDAPVRVEADMSNGQLTIAVANGGKPIPPEALSRLFQPFFRGDGTKGLGLGLYIASEIAQAHGGRLEVASDMDATVFTFTMPLSG